MAMERALPQGAPRQRQIMVQPETQRHTAGTSVLHGLMQPGVDNAYLIGDIQ